MKNALVFAVLLISTRLSAGVEPVLTQQLPGTAFLPLGINISPKVPDNFITKPGTPTPVSFDPNNPNWSAGSSLKRVSNWVKLYSDQNSATLVNFDYDIRVPITITYYLNGVAAPKIVSGESLRLTYHPNPAVQREYQQADVFQFSGGCKVSVTVQTGAAITATRLNSTVQLTAAERALVAATIFLQSGIEVERYFTFNPLDQLCPGAFAATGLLATSNELEIKWKEIVGAEEYDLEWIFVDDYNGLPLGHTLPANLRYDFNQNAARVQVRGTAHKIPLVYEQGYLLWRVRGIGRNPADSYVSPLIGRWSCGQSNCNFQCSDAIGVVGNFLNKYQVNTPHEGDRKNWQAVTTFSEEGKHKTVVSYFDGTMRNRQSVTGLSTDQTTLVGETIYDHQGRPAIQVLPVPVNDATLRYYSNFNQNLVGDPYSRADFDMDNGTCQNDAAPMRPNQRGAAHYYSTFNPDKTIGFHAYIPNAAGYPFTHTLYTPDNTGRISRQGGVGPAHQLYGGHETRYAYAVPHQEELDLLFGNEAGFAMHYKKNAVTDANGQISLTYLDAKGNTIATALAGISPKNLQALPSQNTVTMTVNLLAHNRVDPFTHSLVTYHTEEVVQQSDYTFQYACIPERLNFEDCDGTPYCLDCIYDFEFKIIDNLNCGKLIHHYQATIGELYPLTIPKISLQCGSPAADTWVALPDVTVNLPAGNYTFIKTLTVNEAAADAYVAAVLDTCPALYDSLLAFQYSIMDTSGCDIDCAQAVADANDPSVLAKLTPEQQAELTNLVIDLCDSLHMDACRTAYEAMLADVSPHGQYGAIGSADPMVMAVSVFETNQPVGSAQILTGNFKATGLVFKNPDGSTYPITSTTTAEDLEDNWQPEWAEQLVPFHPEYCYYQFCSANMGPSDRFNAQLQNTFTWQDAVNAGYIVAGNAIALMQKDPFFTPVNPTFSNLLGGYEVTMNNSFINYDLGVPGSNSMMYLALAAANYPNSVAATATWSSVTPAVRDKAWVIYRALYLSRKEELYYKIRTRYAIQNNCYNECIGDQNFNPYLNSFSGALSIGPPPGNTSYFLNAQRNCDYYGYAHLKNKAKRFPSIYDILPGNFPFDFFNSTPADVFNYLYNNAEQQKQEACCDSLANLLPEFIFALVKAGQSNFTLDLTANNAFPNALEAVFLNGQSQATGTFNTNSSGHCIVNFNPAPHPCSRLQFKLPTNINGQITKFCCFREISNPTTYLGPGVHFRMDALISNGNVLPIEGVYDTLSKPQLPCLEEPVVSELQVLFDYLVLQQKFRAGSVSLPAAIVGPNITAQFGPTTGNFTWIAPTTGGANFGATLQRGNFQCKFNFTQTPGITAISWASVIKVESVMPDKTKQDAQGRIRDFKLRFWGTPEMLNGFSECFVLSDCCLPSEPDSLCRPCANLLAGATDTNTVLGNIRPMVGCRPPCDTTEALAWPIINPCVQDMIDLAQHNAQQMYLDSMRTLRDLLKAAYMEQCLLAAERFSATFDDARHHFTLYYYDQANNLVETVPPAGVVPLAQNQLQQVDSHRRGFRVSPVYPAHTLVSRYRYNSLNQLTWQKIPDHTKEDLFFYDGLGRLVASVNARQVPPSNVYTRGFSYTRYDALGRIVEVGESRRSFVGPYSGFLSTLKTKALDYKNWDAFVNAGTRTEITRTEYDRTTNAYAARFPGSKQENLRGRVVCVTWQPNTSPATGTISQVLYSYDIHGNVKTLVQKSFLLDDKTVEYDYDLVSGKVNSLAYQRYKGDQFLHRYTYDADNRLTEVRTSPDGIFWDKDAAYQYYKHGPLARTELGDARVQGLDYAYTLHGWIKGVNSGSLRTDQDMGRDGQSTTAGNFARDAFGYLLSYYDGDYKAIGTGTTNMNIPATAPGLFNGNIRQMTTAIEPFLISTGLPLVSDYAYDQLNRLLKATYNQPSYNKISNLWTSGVADKRWENVFEYDPNGNILRQKRNGDKVASTATAYDMDDLKYNYYSGTNQLRQVTEQTTGLSGNYTVDIDDQTTANNYTYDPIGNLIADAAEKLAIQWNLQGKVSKIVDAAPAQTIDFGYNPMGNRVLKTVNGVSTYHALDASGNVLATYRRLANGSVILESSWLFGSSRLGEYRAEKCIAGPCLPPIGNRTDHTYHITGKRRYEESNHLGNVLAVISDRKVPIPSGATVTAFRADTVGAQDYYAFGMLMVGRTTTSGAGRFGFNGQERDDEVSGNGNLYSAENWEYDARLGKRWNVDPIIKPYESPFTAFANNPISFIDPFGLDKKDPNNKHDDNGDGVSTANEGCGNTTGTWETNDGTGYTGKTAPPFTFPEVEIKPEPEGHTPKGWLDEVFWMGGKGKWEFDQTGGNIWKNSPNYKRTNFQTAAYAFADKAPIGGVVAIATPFVLGGAAVAAPVALTAIGDGALTLSANVIVRYQYYTGTLSGIGSSGLLLGRSMPLVRETADKYKLATIQMPAILQWGNRIAPQLAYNRLWLQYNLRSGTPINFMTNSLGTPTWYSPILRPSIFMDMEIKMVNDWLSK